MPSRRAKSSGSRKKPAHVKRSKNVKKTKGKKIRTSSRKSAQKKRRRK